MKPLLPALVAICLVIASYAHPESDDIKVLPQGKDLEPEAEASDPQTRKERCTTCGTGQLKLNLKSPGNVLAALQALPGAEIHTQQSFESCSSDKGCAGLKVKDGAVVERFGNVDSFRNAVTSEGANEFQFHPGGALGEAFGANPPFWWMNANSPFKNGGGSFEKFSKSSSSFSSSGGAGAAGAGGAVPFIGGSIDISGNPFLNGDFSKVSGGFAGAGGEANKPGGFQSSSFESSSFSSSSKGDVDISKNPFLNGGIKFGQGGFAAQGGFGSNTNQFGAGSTGAGGAGVGATGQGNYGSSQGGQSSFTSQSNSFSSQGQGAGVNGAGLNTGAFNGQFGLSSGATNKFGAAGYTGSSPSPFTASAGGSNVNLIQNTQKQNEFDFEQQQQTQNIDEAFQASGNVHSAHEHGGGELQQTCAGQGYVCVHKAQCNNGVVNTNGAGVLQAKTQKQYCNIKTEICCRMEVSSLSGAGNRQGSLGVGGATYSGSGSQGAQGSNVFATGQSASGSFGAGSSSFGAGQSSSSFGASQSGQGQSGIAGQRGQAGQAGQAGLAGQSGQASFGANSFGASFGSRGTFGQGSQTGQSGFGQGNQGAFAQGSQGQGTFGQSTNTGFSATGSFGSTNSVNRGVQQGTTSGFESGYNANKFASGSGSSTFGSGVGFSTAAPANRFNTNTNFNNEVIKSTSQSNFIETDSFSAGSESAGVYRPGASGTGLKPGIPYLPPVDNINQPTIISSTAVPAYTPRPFTTPRPTTPKPIYRPPVTSTSAPGYLPPEQSDSSNQRETIIPGPYSEGGILLDQNRQPKPRPIPTPNEIPAGCAAALKCTPIEFCTAEGVISNSTVILTRDQESYRVPLTDCKDLESGRIGKCCRDPLYTDPWPTNQLGKWVPGVFGGNDGKYVPDSRTAGNNPRPTQVTVRPPVTGNVILNNFIPAKTTATPFGVNQITPGFPSSTVSSYGQKGQFEVRGQGQYEQGSQGQYNQGGQGQFGVASQGGLATQLAQGSQFASNTQAFKGQGQISTQDQGQLLNQGQGSYVERGQGSFSKGGRGQYTVGGQAQLGVQGVGAQGQYSQFGSESQSQKTFGQGVITGQGQGLTTGQGQGLITGQGQGVITGQGFGVSGQGFGTGYRQGFGQGLVTGQGVGVNQGFGSSIRQGFGQAIVQGEGQASASEDVYRVFLGQYGGNGQCGVLNGQKPYGNRNDLEVDFAEIPWQAMVLLQTNKSLLCGGVITRPEVVITSANCVEGLEAKNVLIKGGEWKLGIDDEPLPFQIVQVKNILRHPFYKSGLAKYDVAILVLAENLRWAKNIYPICLPSASDTLDAFYNGAGECIVTGWGKQVLQAHLAGSILHSVNVSLINPGECQAKLSSDYPHLLEQYDQESCACGQPLNPVNNICKVDIGSALACTTDNEHYVLRGIYSWDSGCQTGNQLAAFYKFDLEWYEWAIGVIESVRFAKYSIGTKVTTNQYSGQLNSGVKGQYSNAAKGSGQYNAGAKAGAGASFAGSTSAGGSQEFGFSQFGSKFSESQANSGFNAAITAPISNSFSASYSEKKVFQTEPKIITYTTKPEIVTFTTKPEYFTYTTKPKLVTYTTKPQLVTYTTKPQIITYETSGSGTNPQYVAPGVSFNPGFTGIAGAHKHNAQCKCLEGKK